MIDSSFRECIILIQPFLSHHFPMCTFISGMHFLIASLKDSFTISNVSKRYSWCTSKYRRNKLPFASMNSSFSMRHSIIFFAAPSTCTCPTHARTSRHRPYSVIFHHRSVNRRRHVNQCLLPSTIPFIWHPSTAVSRQHLPRLEISVLILHCTLR